MFNPGETVCHRFTIPFISDELAKVIVSYKQDGDIVFEKPITSGFEDIDGTKTRITVCMSQEESLEFREMKDYRIQLNVLTKLGSRATSKEIKGHNGVQHLKEVIASV